MKSIYLFFQHLLLLLFFGSLTSDCIAQNRYISGTVLDETGLPLVAANVITDYGIGGTITDFDGNFSISVSEKEKFLLISYVGYQTEEIPIDNVYTITVRMKSIQEMEEVVVTALGVEREEKVLGYAVSQLDAKDIADIKPTNIVDAIAGIAAGAFVTGSSSGPTASSNINIRGTASLLGNNQPLFLVNGMPITNELFSFDDGLNGSSTIDFGNAAQLINPDDIASINILKGPAASALYGSRAADGVILIETKTGASNKGWGATINSSTTIETPLKLPDYQNEFGFGGGGKYSYANGSNYIGAQEYYEAYGENWGPRLNGQAVKQFDSNDQAVPFTPAEDNIRDFYQTGVTSINNIAISNSSEAADARFSFTNLNKKGIVPNTDLQRNTFNLNIGNRLLDNKLKTRINAMYIRSGSSNIPNAGYDESSSIAYGWLWFPRQVEIGALRDYWVPGQEGVEQRYVENLWVNNPWFVANENTNSFQSNRLIGNFEASYDFLKKLNLRVRYGADVVNEGRQYRRAPSTKAVLLGSYREDEISFSETNAEALLSYDAGRISNFTLELKAGGNIMRQNANYLVANNPELKFFGTSPSVYSLTNSRSGVLVESQKTQTGINSAFGIATIGFKEMIYIDATYRQDWNSTLVNPALGLAGSDYQFGYPSVSFTGIVSDMINMRSSNISFFKVRAAYAEVGNGAPDSRFGNTFTPQPAFGSNSVFTTNRTIADPNLRNERTTAYEVGLDVRWFKDRLRLDATAYDMRSFDQIIFLPVGTSSGYDFNLTNGGTIRNRGVELFLKSNVMQRDRFGWEITLNAAHNRAVVEELPDVIESGRYSIVADLFPGDEGGADLEYVAEEGELLGQLYGLGFVRGPDGRIVHQNGLPVLTKEKVSAGSYQPDLRIGLYNRFSFGNFRLGFLIDGQVGGKIYSRSHALYNTGGAITNADDPLLPVSTLDGRTAYSVSYDADGEPVYSLEQSGGIVGPGWKWEDSNENGQVDVSELQENDVAVEPGGAGYTGYFYNYYGNGFNRDNIEAATYDATYFKVREARIGYTFDDMQLAKLGIDNIQVALIGRNLLLFSDVPTIDPETYSIRNGLFVPGFESTQLPTTRSVGVALNVVF
ncbi:MAG: SusC/RagA family TonB-linked outer membrane protein [Saprospiraceae bacterium]